MQNSTDSRIQHCVDLRRGCGWRKQGGFYLVASQPAIPCDALPASLEVCSSLVRDKKTTTRWKWLVKKVGLLWISRRFYRQPEDFIGEARELGFCISINRIPKGFKLGETWVALAHNTKTIFCPDCVAKKVNFNCRTCGGKRWILKPSVFGLFKPEAVQYVTDGTEESQFIDGLVERGITPVKVERAKQKELAI